MTTTVRVFRWDDASAPTVEGVVGSFSTAMTLMLVGSSGVAYGSGVTEKLAAGWTVAYTGTNKVALRNTLAAGGTGCYLRIDDSGGGAGGAKEALIQVFESMTNVDTGTGPASSLNSNLGVWIRKSETAGAGARAWVVIADGRTFYIGTYSTSSTVPTPANTIAGSQYSTIGGGGDIEPILPGDVAVFVAGRPTANETNYAGSTIGMSRDSANIYMGSNQGFSVSRNNMFSATPTPVTILALGGMANSADQRGFGGNSSPMVSLLPGSSTITLCHPAWLAGERGIRGRMRGLSVPINKTYDTKNLGYPVSPIGGAPGSSMISLAGLSAGASNDIGMCARLFVETALTWG